MHSFALNSTGTNFSKKTKQKRSGNAFVFKNQLFMNEILIEIARLKGVLTGLKICKEMWAQGQISHESIYENEILYKEEIEILEKKIIEDSKN